MHRLLLAAALLLPPLTAQAQIAHADFDNLIYDDGQSMGGPNLLLAIRTQAPASFVATRVEVFTGERTGLNTIALWSHDAANNQPLAPLGAGTWQMGQLNGWQGAPLAAPVALTAGQDIWVVWGCQDSSQASIQGSGPGAQPYRGSFNGGASWNGPYQSLQWKFRIWSGPAGHYESYGAGCNGTAGVPRLGWAGLPLAGASFDLLLDRAVANTISLLTLGDSDTNANGLPLPFSLQPLGAPGCSLLSSSTVTVASLVDAAGQAALTVSLPPDPSLVGFRFYDQWFCFDAAANAFGFTASNGGAATVGA
ncbi:MAG TPA: hypothetical protein VFZ65_20650 [Planctomycetota bacterium]|nr:hypothetical protein [Planctomycetota bacterium]